MMKRLLGMAAVVSVLAGCGAARGNDPWAAARRIPGFQDPFAASPWPNPPAPALSPGYGYWGKQPLGGQPGVGFAGNRPLTGCFRDAMNNVFCDQ